jgi:3-deoxy-D-manno-octulosonate 8-phosphate phosphatase (KDO 8-P phosphatase)
MTFDNRLDLPRTVVDAARRVELIAMDVDGVLTDGHTYQLDNGEQFLCFSVMDALGLTLCGMVGLKLAVISGRDLPCARIRMERFQIAEMHFGCVHKEPVLEEIGRRQGVPLERMAYIGDDLIDLPLLARVGLPVCVPNAAEEVRAAALYCTRSAGGEGAVRELIVLVLKARGLYDKAATEYLKAH